MKTRVTLTADEVEEAVRQFIGLEGHATFEWKVIEPYNRGEDETRAPFYEVDVVSEEEMV